MSKKQPQTPEQVAQAKKNEVAYKAISCELSTLAEQTTNRKENEIIITLGTAKHKAGFKVLGDKAMGEGNTGCVSIELDKGLRGDEMVAAYRKACLAVVGGTMEPDTFLITSGRGKNTETETIDKRMTSHGTAAKIIALNWPGIKMGEKKARGNNGTMNNVTFTGAVMGRTDTVKVAVDTVIGCKVLKVVLVCEGMADIEYAPDEEHMARANAKSDEIQARIDGEVAKVNVSLNKAQTTKDKAIATLAKAQAKLDKLNNEAAMLAAKNEAVERQLKMAVANQ